MVYVSSSLDHKIFHLENSQLHLREILKGCTNDLEFSTVIEENEIIIKNKRDE